MADIIKSNNMEAENESNAIKSQGSSISQVASTGGGLTNLTVMGKMESVVEHINSSNAAYIDLLSKDATAISDVKDTYNGLDSDISACMGVE